MLRMGASRQVWRLWSLLSGLESFAAVWSALLQWRRTQKPPVVYPDVLGEAAEALQMPHSGVASLRWIVDLEGKKTGFELLQKAGKNSNRHFRTVRNRRQLRHTRLWQLRSQWSAELSCTHLRFQIWPGLAKRKDVALRARLGWTVLREWQKWQKARQPPHSKDGAFGRIKLPEILVVLVFGFRGKADEHCPTQPCAERSLAGKTVNIFPGETAKLRSERIHQVASECCRWWC